MSIIPEDVDLQNMEKSSLIEIIKSLKTELTKKNDDFMRLTNLRLYHLERSHNMYLQYNNELMKLYEIQSGTLHTHKIRE